MGVAVPHSMAEEGRSAKIALVARIAGGWQRNLGWVDAVDLGGNRLEVTSGQVDSSSILRMAVRDRRHVKSRLDFIGNW